MAGTNCLLFSLCQRFASLAGRTTPALVRYVIDGDYILQDFGEDGVSYLSKDQFDKLATGEEEADQGVNLNAWCVVKLA